MTASRLVVVSGGLRAPSSTRLLADQLGEAVVEALSPAGRDAGREVERRTIELREHAHAITDALLTGFPTGALRDVVDEVIAADALVVVSPTFSASYSGLFKSFCDLFESGSLPATPTLLGATGGTERHSLVLEHALRPLFVYLGAAPVRTGVYAAISDFGGDGASGLQARIRRAAAELASAVDGGTSKRPVPGGTVEVVPMAELLGGAPAAPDQRGQSAARTPAADSATRTSAGSSATQRMGSGPSSSGVP